MKGCHDGKQSHGYYEQVRRNRPGGETGKRRGLKIPRPRGLAGSKPAPGTS